MIRNSIDVIGIVPENELPGNINGQVLQYSETETIFIEGKHKIRTISQIQLELYIKSNRIINSPLGKIVVLDGLKRFKLRCSEKDSSKRENIIEFETPYNSFFELPNGVSKYTNLEVYIVDAYFHLLDSNKLYSHIIYLVNVFHDTPKVNDATKSSPKDNNNSTNYDTTDKTYYISNINAPDNVEY